MSITFREFVELVEGKKKEKKKNKNLSPSMPPNVVPGTYHRTPEYTEYTLAPYTGPSKPFKKPKDVTRELNNQGGTGRKAIEKVIKQRRKEEQQEGFSYGNKSYQQELEKKRKEAEERKRKEEEQRNNAAREAFRHGEGMVSYEKDPKTGKVVRGRRTKDGVFTPDTQETVHLTLSLVIDKIKTNQTSL